MPLTPSQSTRLHTGRKISLRYAVTPPLNTHGAALWPREFVERPGVWLFNGQERECPFTETVTVEGVVCEIVRVWMEWVGDRVEWVVRVKKL